MNKKELQSSLLLALSLILFSVVVPVIQEKIDYWKHQRDVFEGNLLNSEFQRVVGILAGNTYETMDILKNSHIATNPETLKLIEKIQKLYLEKAQKASVNMQFLQTEPVNNDDRPDKKRYDEIKKKIEEQSPLINKEAELFLDNFNRDYQKELNFWGNCKTATYSSAIIFYFCGIWFGLRKRDPCEDLVKEVRGLISRINTLIKKPNRNT